MSRKPKEWHNVQIKESLFKKIRSLAFPDDLEHRKVCSALLECAFDDPALIKKALEKVKVTQ